MKVVFFLVALANVAFFMWEYNKNAVEQAAEKAKTPDSPVQESIMLIDELNQYPAASRQTGAIAGGHGTGAGGGQTRSEREEIAGLAKEPQKERPQSTADTKTSQEGQPICVEAGPFFDEKLLDEWSKRLSAVNARIQQQARTEQTVSDYLVFQPAAETPEQSEANLEILKNQGFADVWRMKEGGGIALGVFKKEERAEAMKEQLQAKGIYAEVMPRFKKQLQKYVLIKGGGQVPENLTSLQKNYPRIAVKPATSCAEP
jgi:hypothetical protein